MRALLPLLALSLVAAPVTAQERGEAPAAALDTAVEAVAEPVAAPVVAPAPAAGMSFAEKATAVVGAAAAAAIAFQGLKAMFKRKPAAAAPNAPDAPTAPAPVATATPQP